MKKKAGKLKVMEFSNGKAYKLFNLFTSKGVFRSKRGSRNGTVSLSQ